MQKGLARGVILSLPEDVWRNVASHMTLREWARVSGLCKSTWKLDLHSILVPEQGSLGVQG